MFAALAQHLCTALVPLDVDAAHGALLDGHVRVAAGAGPACRVKDTHMQSAGAQWRVRPPRPPQAACEFYIWQQKDGSVLTLNWVNYFGIQRLEVSILCVKYGAMGSTKKLCLRGFNKTSS